VLRAVCIGRGLGLSVPAGCALTTCFLGGWFSGWGTVGFQGAVWPHDSRKSPGSAGCLGLWALASAGLDAGGVAAGGPGGTAGLATRDVAEGAQLHAGGPDPLGWDNHRASSPWRCGAPGSTTGGDSFMGWVMQSGHRVAVVVVVGNGCPAGAGAELQAHPPGLEGPLLNSPPRHEPVLGGQQGHVWSRRWTWGLAGGQQGHGFPTTVGLLPPHCGEQGQGVLVTAGG
jgi:hypothetical protein